MVLFRRTQKYREDIWDFRTNKELMTSKLVSHNLCVNPWSGKGPFLRPKWYGDQLATRAWAMPILGIN